MLKNMVKNPLVGILALLLGAFVIAFVVQLNMLDELQKELIETRAMAQTGMLVFCNPEVCGAEGKNPAYETIANAVLNSTSDIVQTEFEGNNGGTTWINLPAPPFDSCYEGRPCAYQTTFNGRGEVLAFSISPPKNSGN